MILNKNILWQLLIIIYGLVLLLRSSFFLSYPALNFEYIVFYSLLLFSLIAGVCTTLIFFNSYNSQPLLASPIPHVNPTANKIIRYLAGVWFIVFIYYFWQQKDLFLHKSLTQIRYDRMQQATSASYSGILLDAFGFFCVINFILDSLYTKSYVLRLRGGLFLLAYIAYNALSGGRLGLLITVVYIGMFYVLLGYWKKVPFKYKCILYLFFLIFIFYCADLFLQREAYRGRSIEEGIKNYIDTYYLSGSGKGEFNYILISFWVYLTHPVNEFYYTFMSHEPHWWGSYSFYKIFYLLAKLNLYDFNLSQLKVISRVGVYRGLFGSVYIDFGIFSFVYLFVLGFFSAYFQMRFLISSHIKYFFIFCTFMLTLLWSPVFYVFNVANGLSMLFCTLFYFLLSFFVIKKTSIGNCDEKSQ
ncbi:oligosaccharide repeat unit polymerase [Legionella israelensis]|uniref:O-antigen polymerase n=1 Tax=Legionella israelensis TaxID=454 RepID=UPI00117DA208|nr:O-antigen polymerase [Legionella israelensis]QDP72368.1 oligosaccharide repeat unit polymerase [Legionella israelensis]